FIVNDVGAVIDHARERGLEIRGNEFVACGTRMIVRES
ncbi:MAG: hypothetical protein ACI8W3_001442, partial [Myxococcota bacterium]